MTRRTAAEQALLDLISQANAAGDTDGVKIYQQALEKERRARYRLAADKTYQSHQYKGCRYGQLSNVADNPAVWPMVRSLSPRACQVLLLILVIVKTEFFCFSHEHIAKIANLQTKKSVSPIIKELLEEQAICLVQDRTNKDPAVYRINSCLLRIGKLRRAKDIDIDKFFGGDVPKGYNSTEEWFQILYRRLETPEYRQSREGWYSGTRKIRLSIDGQGVDTIVSTIDYYTPPQKDEELPPKQPTGDSPHSHEQDI